MHYDKLNKESGIRGQVVDARPDIAGRPQYAAVLTNIQSGTVFTRRVFKKLPAAVEFAEYACRPTHVRYEDLIDVYEETK